MLASIIESYLNRASPDMLQMIRSNGGSLRGAEVRCDRWVGHRNDWCRTLLTRWELDDAGYLVGDDTFGIRGQTHAVLAGQRDPVSRSQVSLTGWSTLHKGNPPGVPPGVTRFSVRCKCGAEYVMRDDRILPVLERKARVGDVKSNGWVEVHTGEL